VDLGAADGLIPISELSWSRVGDPSEIVSIGQKVEVVVHRLDRDARKVTLSLRGTIRSPWDDFAEQNKAGSRLTGKVTRIADFGAFVEVSPGVEGLIHVSEMSTQRVRRVRDVVQEGQTVEVQLINIDPGARRMSLSLKSLKAEAEEAEHAKTAAEEEADRKEAEERMAARKANPNLRGGIGGGKLWWEKDE
jgi:small subunit ribosomal protein S1